MAQQKQVDQERVKQMRKLMSEGGDKAVQHRFGEDATNSAEFKQAERDRQRARQSTRDRARQGSAGKESSQHGANRGTPSEKSKVSEREKALKARKEAADREKQSLSR